MSSTAVFTISGMSCGHCEQSISTQVSSIPGVTEAVADAPSGRLTISSEHPLDDELIRSAVDEAGFELVGRAAAASPIG